MHFELPVSWSKEKWPTDLTSPALTIEEFVGALRHKNVSLDALDPQLLRVAAFGHYCGSVAGDGHVDFICNNEADFFDQITLAEEGAKLLGLDQIASLLQEYRALLPSANVVDVYSSWAKDEIGLSHLSALDPQLFAMKVSSAEHKVLSGTLVGPAKEGFDAAVASSKYNADDPHYVCLYAWLAGYDHLDYGTFAEARAKTERISAMLSSQ